MILAIVGGRDFKDYGKMEAILEDIESMVTQVVSGGAKGADTLGKYWAESRNIPVREFLPDWERYGKKAGPLRNKEIIEACDRVVLFWDGKSRGTASSLKIAIRLRKRYRIVYYS